ncbi:hypothetical protein BC829DRAFT_406928, partial [Chytridium lagenaria]
MHPGTLIQPSLDPLNNPFHPQLLLNPQNHLHVASWSPHPHTSILPLPFHYVVNLSWNRHLHPSIWGISLQPFLWGRSHVSHPISPLIKLGKPVPPRQRPANM